MPMDLYQRTKKYLRRVPSKKTLPTISKMLFSLFISLTGSHRLLHSKVEGTFFKVPRHHFEHSVFFRDMFSAETDKGWTKEKPFHVDGLSKHDFVAFLKIICPRSVVVNSLLCSQANLTSINVGTSSNPRICRLRTGYRSLNSPPSGISKKPANAP